MAEGRGSKLGWVVGLVLASVFTWALAGTEWSLVVDQEAMLHGIVIDGPRSSGEGVCEATLDLAALPAQPSAVVQHGASGDTPVPLEGTRGAITYPAGDAVRLRLTFEGVLRKPSHAEIQLAQSGCRLQPASLESMPFLPF